MLKKFDHAVHLLLSLSKWHRGKILKRYSFIASLFVWNVIHDSWNKKTLLFKKKGKPKLDNGKLSPPDMYQMKEQFVRGSFFCTQPFSPEQLMQKIRGNGCRIYICSLYSCMQRDFWVFSLLRSKPSSRQEEIVCSVNNFDTIIPWIPCLCAVHESGQPWQGTATIRGKFLWHYETFHSLFQSFESRTQDFEMSDILLELCGSCADIKIIIKWNKKCGH